jgi:hypothetical protein
MHFPQNFLKIIFFQFDAPVRLSNFIGGEQDVESRLDTIPNFAPASNTLIALVPKSGPAEVEKGEVLSFLKFPQILCFQLCKLHKLLPLQ